MASKGPKYGTFADVDGGQLLDQLRFLAKAATKSGYGYRPMMAGINIEVVTEATEETPYPILRGISTDGRRLHIVDPLNQSAAPLFALSVGRWDVISNSQSRVQLAKMNDPEGDFPNWRKVVPSDPVVHTTQFGGLVLSGKRLFEASVHLYKLARAFPECDPIMLDFLADLGYGDSWTVEWRKKGGSIVFRNQNVKTSVIMPMNAGDE